MILFSWKQKLYKSILLLILSGPVSPVSSLCSSAPLPGLIRVWCCCTLSAAGVRLIRPPTGPVI